MALYVEISRRTPGQTAWESLGNAELGPDDRTLMNLSIPVESLGPHALEVIADAISHDQRPHPEEPLVDQLGEVSVGDTDYAYRTIFANAQVPGG